MLFDTAELLIAAHEIQHLYGKSCSPGIILCPGFKRRDHKDEGIGKKLPKVQVEKTGCWQALWHLITFSLMGKWEARGEKSKQKNSEKLARFKTFLKSNKYHSKHENPAQAQSALRKSH